MLQDWWQPFTDEAVYIISVQAVLARWTLTIYRLSGTHLFTLLLGVLTSHWLSEKDSVSWIGHPHKNSSWLPPTFTRFLIKSGRIAALFITWRSCNGNLRSIQKGKHPSQMWKKILSILLLLYFSCLYFSTSCWVVVCLFFAQNLLRVTCWFHDENIQVL